MAWTTSVLCSCTLLVFQVLAVDLGWHHRQSRHTPLQLEDYGLLESVALLDQQLDPEAQLWTSLLEPLLVSRYVGTPAHEDVRQHLVNVLTALGWTVDGNRTFTMRTPLGEMPFTNVVATHDPAAPRRLVLACHYDSIYGRDAFVAATDSAVPCAMMLYLACLMTSRYLDPMKGRSELTLQLMFLDGEEAFVRWTDQDSIYGARHLAQELQRTPYRGTGGGSNASLTELDRIDCFVLLDLLGAARPAIANYQAGTKAEFRRLAAIERQLSSAGLLPPDLPAAFHFHQSWSGWGAPQISDDHLPFLRRGVKVLHLIPHPFPSVWHKDADDARAVHFPTVAGLSRTLRVFVSEHLGLAAYL
ncbi:glutaminyl-peptide cyclotransferase-like protein [Pollicipes pollicipes]|uniref:glutaminyl-peptide cyclotransferase-like protein n=1 Tax=Pollicipes pollicipes TaxID=41117 RepID=UPI0018854856|nr:glutaminyl-peptide cyclotransferase-like protein [Pollicipes pollicipes]